MAAKLWGGVRKAKITIISLEKRAAGCEKRHEKGVRIGRKKRVVAKYRGHTKEAKTTVITLAVQTEVCCREVFERASKRWATGGTAVRRC